MFQLLKQIDPPLGFGNKCPDLLAYKRLVRMNMPIDDEGKVHFTTTLFALVRINLQIFMRSIDEMDQADQELRQTIGRTWPYIRRDGKIDLWVPPASETGPNKLTVGKIYGGMLILENWKQTRFSALPAVLTRKHLPNGDAGQQILDLVEDMKATEDGRKHGKSRRKSSTAVDSGHPPVTSTISMLSPKKNDLVRNYLDTLEPPTEEAALEVPCEEEERPPRLPPRTFPRPIEPVYANTDYQQPLLPMMGPMSVPQLPPEPMWPSYEPEFQHYHQPPPHMLQQQPLQQPHFHNRPYLHERHRGVSVDRHRDYQTPQYYEDAYYRQDESNRRVNLKHILSSSHRAQSSLGLHRQPRRQLPQPRPLERHLSHPNLRERPMGVARRQLPQTPTQPPATIVVIENVLPEQNFRTAGSASNVARTNVHRIDRRRSFSLPRRKKTLPAIPATALPSIPPPQPQPTMPPTSQRSASVYISGRHQRSGSGRRLPRTPTQSALALHHTPAGLGSAGPKSRKRQLPKPKSLDLRHSKEEIELLFGAGINGTSAPRRSSLRAAKSAAAAAAAAAAMSRVSSRSMNFPRVEGSPSHSGGSISNYEFTDDLCLVEPMNVAPPQPELPLTEMTLDYSVPLSSIPVALRTNYYRDRRTLLE